MTEENKTSVVAVAVPVPVPVPAKSEPNIPDTFWGRVWDKLVRWRTWVVNSFLGVIFGIIFTPDLVLALLGFNWGTIIPKEYVPFVSLATVVLNVWMRPRPAARGRDFNKG